MKDLLNRYGVSLTALMVLLVAFWLLVLVIVPNLYLFENSFRPYLPVTEMGGPKDVYTLKNYLTFFQSPIHISVFFWTVLYSSIVTTLCFFMAYPLAYYLSKKASAKSLPTIFLLLTIPLWVSEIMRSFAWFIILSLKGPLNYFLINIHLIDKPIRWMTGFRSVMIGLVYTYVLFMLFPIYNAIQSLDTSQIEAADDLGAPWWRIHWRVILPHAKPGIASGSVMVFMLSAGSILVPTLLASTNSRWFTEIIQQWMFESLDWNTGAAYAFLLLILCTVFVTLVMRIFRVKLSDIAK
ncbi:spermidine/putrescine transport system permease protein [Pararhizobium capsulatum DSM 1112]|uniref:Spermidine/putrescine transport system permease protein n=1 Tax=Pararhizobium capsulatum DSM 1112 TaxID=1121113 RepID=A0ABU0BVG1_9HYPH|nr:ABC transporter permease [Pararhizobium capsulatum]MDQ0322241.1 spermidine/putrescine transport system permease protein [Pararhizobium capsulatum DSM 1112]